MIRTLFARGLAALALLSLAVSPAMAQLAVKDANAATQTITTVTQSDGSKSYGMTPLLPQVAATAGLAVSFGTTATPLFNANTARHFIVLQVQGAQDTTGAVGCWINGSGTATNDANSLFIARGSYFESSTHVGTGAISIVCSAANMAVYSRQG